MADDKVDPLDPGEESDIKTPSETDASTSASPKQAKKARKKRTWRRRLWLLFIGIVVIGIVIRIAVQVAFPIVLSRVAGSYGLAADYRQFRMSMLSGDVGLGRLEFKNQKTGEAFANANYVRATISPLKLLIGQLEVWRVEADGVDVHVRREADGSIAVIDDLLKASAQAEPVVKPVVTGEPTMINLTSPAHIEGFRLQHLRLHLTDKTMSPPVEAMVQLDVRVDEVGSRASPASFYINLYSDPVLDALTIEGQAVAKGATLDADMKLSLKGLHLRPLAPYLEPVGLKPIAHDISAHASGTLKTTPAALVTAVSQLSASTRPKSQPTTGPGATIANTDPPSPATRPADTGSGAVVADAGGSEFIGGSLKLRNLYVLADGKEAAACDTLDVDLSKVNLATAQLSRVLIDGVRANAVRNEQGNLEAVGIELVPVTPSTQPAMTDAVAAGAKPRTVATGAPATMPATQAFRASLDELLLTNARFALEDRSVTPVTPIAFEVERLSVQDLLLDPNKPDAQMRVAGAFRSPGIARTLRLDGVAKPFAQRKTLNLTFEVGGIEPAILRPYLDFAGLESTLEDGSFKAELWASATVDPSGSVGANVHLGSISFRDRDELFGLSEVSFSGIALNAATGVMRVDDISISGPTLGFKREKSGALSGFGFVTKTPTPRKPLPERPSQPGALQLVKFELGRLSWRDVAVKFQDDASNPPATVAIGDAGLEITGLTFDLENLEPATRPGRINGWLVAPNVAEKLTVAGTLTPNVNSLVADLQFSGQGITGAGLRGYLHTVGVDPQLKDGSFLAHVKASVENSGKELRASVSVEDVVYADGQTELAGVDRIKVAPIVLSGSTLSLGSIEIARPRASVTIDQQKAIIVGGIRYVAPPARTLETVPTETVTHSPASASAGPTIETPSIDTGSPEPSESFGVVLSALKLSDATLTFRDQSAAKPVETTARVNVDLGSVALGRESAPADLNVRLKADNLVESVAITGKVLANPKNQGATLSVDVRGLQPSALEGYLPPGVAIDLKDGRLTTQVDAAVEQLQQGGLKARLLLDGADFRDGENGASLLKLDQFRVVAPRLDPGGDAIAIDEVVLSGFEMDTVRKADGTFSVLGLAIGGTASGEPAAQVQAVPPADHVASASSPLTQPVVLPASQPTSAPVSAASLVTKARKAPPLVTLDKLDLNVRRIGYLDQSSPENKPLTVSELRFRLLEKLSMLGKDPAGQPAARFQLTGKIDPLIGAIDFQAQTAPFAQQPTLNADLTLNGINGEGLFAVLPALRQQIDATGLKEGQFKAKLEATAKVERRGPMDVDYGKGFDIEALARNIEFRVKPGGEVALGLDEVRVEDAKFRPVKDDAGQKIGNAIRVKSVDVTKPVGFVVRDAEAIRVAGLAFKLPAKPTTQPSAGVEEAVAVSQPSEPKPMAEVPATAQAVAAKPVGEIRVDKFTVSGIDFRAVDRSVDPPFVLPLTALDLDVRDASNMLLYEPDRALRFSASLNADKVTVPKKLRGGVIGAVGDMANLLGGGGKAQPETTGPEYEDRELFSQISAAGRITLFPKPDGYAKVNVSSFELAAIGGFARQAGIDLTYGTFDLPLDLRGDGNGGFIVDTRPSFTDLSVTEKPGGPIVRYLALPGALDVAIGAVEAADKSITIPVRGVTVTAESGGAYSIGGIGKQIQPAVSSVFLNALAAMPVKAVTGVTSVIGLDALLAGDQKPEEPIVLSFPAGYTALEPTELAKVRALADRMKKEPELTISVKHDLGGGDLNIAEVRANPTTADAQALAYALRQRKVELSQARHELAASARTVLATGGGTDSTAAVEQLRAIDRELSRTEDALDRAFDLMRPGADRQAPRRTRSAALDLGQERLDAVRSVLVEAQVPTLVDRLKPSKPAFAPSDNADGGRVTITLVKVKK